jgi:uncharacterized membrane protein
MWMMWLWAIVLVGLIVGGVLAARLLCNRSEPDQRPSRRGGRPALDVLDERYPRGEIDRDEFERRGPSFFPKPAAEDHDAIIFV